MDKRSRKVYILWGVALTLLLALGLFSWLVVVPVNFPENPDERGRDGPYKSYYESGQLRCVISYKNGERFGKCSWWYRSGTKSREGFYAGDKDLGHDEFDKTTRITTGIKDGLWREWDKTGKLIASGTFKNGQYWEGSFYSYYGDNLDYGHRGHAILTYDKGVQHGDYRTWYGNWKKWIEGQFTDGKEEALWEYWGQDGELIASGTFRAGRPWQGTFQRWDGSRRRWIIATYAEGKRTAAKDWQYSLKPEK